MSDIFTNDKDRALFIVEFLPWSFMDDFLNAGFYNAFVDRSEFERIDEYVERSKDKFSEFSDKNLESLRQKFNESLNEIRKLIGSTFYSLDHAPDKLLLLPEKKVSDDPALKKEYNDAFSSIEGLIDNCSGNYKNMVSAIKDYLESLQPQLVQPDKVEKLEKEVKNDAPSKEGRRWENITMKFVDGQEVIITDRGKPRGTNFEEMGFMNKKNRLPTMQWHLLTSLSKRGGEMTWRNNHDLPQKDIDAIKHRKHKLAHQLMEYFGMTDDPFEYNTEEKSYRLKISLEPEVINEPRRDRFGISEYLEEVMTEVDDSQFSPDED